MQAPPEDRLLLLLGIFATAGRTADGRPTSDQLQALTQLGSTLRPGYRSERRPETIERIGDAAAGLFIEKELLTPRQAAELVPWLQGAEAPELEQRLQLEGRIVKCTGSMDIPCAESSVIGLRARWFDPEQDTDGRWVPALRMCARHNRAQQTPQAALWEEGMARDLHRVPLLPIIEARLRQRGTAEGERIAAEARARRDKIIDAFHAARAAFQAVKYKPWAERAGLDNRELRGILSQAGLPEKPREGKKHFGRYLIVPVLWYALSASTAHAAVAEHGPDKISESLPYRHLWSWLLDRLRRWAQADRLRRWLAGLAGPTLAGAPA